MTAPIKWSDMPMSLPNGGLLPHMSARMRTQIVDAVFEGAGGATKLLAWVEASDENYGEFVKIWSRGAAKAVSTEVNLGDGVEALLAKLDAGDHARVINGADFDDDTRT